VLRGCKNFAAVKDIVWTWLPWTFPTGKGKLTDYVYITSHRDSTTGIVNVTHVTIKPRVLEEKDWSWLPRLTDGT
jgi:hypothetical protein